MSVSKATFLAAVLAFAGALNAQERKTDVDVKTGPNGVKVDVNTKRDDGTIRKDATTIRKDSDPIRGMAHRASEINGMTVKNAADKELGTVKDIVINVRSGQVRYAAVSYGGFLGLGDKLFAVPWYAFEHRHDASSNKHTLVLNVDEQTLKNAPGFDKNSWPNFGDAAFGDELDKHYSKYRRTPDNATGVDIKAGPVAVDVNTTRRADANNAKDVVKRASEIMGMTVMNTADKDVGSVNDLMVDMSTGKVRYAALSFGGFLGLGNKLFAIPWSSFDCRYNANKDKYHLVLAVDEATLKQAPGFDKDKWPNIANPKFGEEIDLYYGPTRVDPSRPQARN